MAKKFTVSIVEAAWIIYAINYTTGIDLVKAVGDLIGGKLNLKAQLTSGLTAAIKKLQADPANLIIVLGIAYLIKQYAHKALGRRKILDLGDFRITM